MALTTLLIDDHDIVRAGLRQVIQMDGRLRIVAEAENAGDALRLFEFHKPEIVVTDLRLPDMPGVDMVRHMRTVHPAARIVVVSGFIDGDEARALLETGAMAILGKTRACYEFGPAMDSLLAGQTYISPSLR